MTLNETMNEIADAIREKTGKSEKIAPVNFAEEIKSISAGGGESGGSNVEYWDISANASIIGELALFCQWIKTSGEYGIDILSPWHLSTPNVQPLAIALDRNAIIVLEGSKMTVGEFYQVSGLPEFTQLGWSPITEAEFYDLNA